MLTYFFLYFLTGVVMGVAFPIGFLPNAVLPDFVASSLSTIAGYYAGMTTVVDIPFFVGVLIAGLAVENYQNIYKLAKWVWSKIPGVS